MKKVISVRLPDSQIEAIRQLAEKRMVSQGMIIEEAISLLLATTKGTAETFYDLQKQPHYPWRDTSDKA
ncbi:ribbon-helix-helix domain-containing protein [Brevundimonas sp. BR2-1]|uniref:ribbon-helix-helix domain-containing protein n=1 Tax=Brevundimonas sp. BR2-1 TaxID=3031123 RepID=UPI00309D240E